MSDVARRFERRPSCANELAEIASCAGLERIHLLGWRDLDDPEAGGSELHASTVARLWAEAGIDVTMRSSRAVGRPVYDRRDGYRVIRKAGRYTVFPRTAISGLIGRTGPRDALVEIWNGMPFFSPVWARCPRVVFLHHVHAEMWRMVLKPEFLGRVGESFERRIAPMFYQNARIITLSTSSKDEIVELLGLSPDNISVVPPGIDCRFSPGEPPSPHPLVVAVGRLVPVKRFDVLITSLVTLKAQHPDLEAVIVGEGYDRPALESQVRASGAESWISLPGRLNDDALVSLYRRAWVLASSSVREGWGMTITEAAACGTPAVASRIAGHIDAVDEGHSGFLTSNADEMASALDEVLSKPAVRARLRRGALAHASRFTWENTARQTLVALAEEVYYRRGIRPVSRDLQVDLSGEVIDLRPTLRERPHTLT